MVQIGKLEDFAASAVVLVDENDADIGVAEKLAAHRLGYLHRAISVSLGDGQGRVLLQRRALGKYHSGGLWSNTCCSHPGLGETPADAARRRLREEMGIAADLEWRATMRYRDDVGGGLIENELVHIFVGTYDGPISPDPGEVAEYRWLAEEELREAVKADPSSFTVWFRKYVSGRLLEAGV